MIFRSQSYNNEPNGGAGDEEGSSSSSRRGPYYNPGGRARLHHEQNVKETLAGIGFEPALVDQVWQALGVLARNDIMTLGMGLGLVKKRAGKHRLQQQQQERQAGNEDGEEKPRPNSSTADSVTTAADDDPQQKRPFFGW